jgi:hypothetical protein
VESHILGDFHEELAESWGLSHLFKEDFQDQQESIEL